MDPGIVEREAGGAGDPALGQDEAGKRERGRDDDDEVMAPC
jgi:hypothetical protein